MGCDIHGAVEGLGAHERWRYVADVGSLVGRSYDTFGSLWGVRNYSQFDPAFPDRGFPDEMSLTLKHEIRSWVPEDADFRSELDRIDFHSASWATIDELHGIDWAEESDELDSRISILDENKEPTGTKAGGFGKASGWYDVLKQDDNRERLDNGEPIPNEDGTRYIQRRKQTRREALSGSWEWVIFDLMPICAERFEDVRMTVWFDN